MAKIIDEKLFGQARYRIFTINHIENSRILFETDEREVFLTEWNRNYFSLHAINSMLSPEDFCVSFDFEDDMGYRHGGGGGDRNKVSEFIDKYYTEV